jgi:hypothetical protein
MAGGGDDPGADRGPQAGPRRLASRRWFVLGTAAAFGGVLLPVRARLAVAQQPPEPERWVANHMSTHLTGSDGAPVTWLPAWTNMRLLRELPNGWLEVWVPRGDLVGRIPASAVGGIPTPSPDVVAAESAEPLSPPVIEPLMMPGRVVGGGNLRSSPAVRRDTLLRSLGHNAPVRVLARVEGEDGAEWLFAEWLDGAMQEKLGEGYVEASLIRMPRLGYVAATDDRSGRWFEVDLTEPALLTAFEDGAPIWASLTIKGRAASRTRLGSYEILRRVPSETMNSETLVPPIPRNSPRGYYLTNVLWTQYFHGDGSSIHYNYWSSSWGYAGSNGCLGLPQVEAKFAWDFAEVGTPVHIFA